jgi:hypothetical protein
MATSSTCDVCQKPCERVVAKLFLAPVGENTRKTHADYTAHADVGECCAPKLISGATAIKWQKRKKIKRRVTT